MAVEAGSAYARFIFDVGGVRTAAETAISEIRRLREAVQQPIPINININVDEEQLSAMASSIRKQVQAKFGADIEIPVILKVREERGAAQRTQREQAAPATRAAQMLREPPAPTTHTQLPIEAAIAAATPAPKFDREAFINAERDLSSARGWLAKITEDLGTLTSLATWMESQLDLSAGTESAEQWTAKLQELRAELVQLQRKFDDAQQRFQEAARVARDLRVSGNVDPRFLQQLEELGDKQSKLYQQLSNADQHIRSGQGSADNYEYRELRQQVKDVDAAWASLEKQIRETDITARNAEVAPPAPARRIARAYNTPEPVVPATSADARSELEAARAAQQSAAAINQVAGAHRNLANASNVEVDAIIRAARASKDYAQAIDLTKDAIGRAVSSNDNERAAQLTARLRDIEGQAETTENERAISRARLAATTGNYADALEMLKVRIDAVGRSTDAGVQLERTYHEILRAGTREAYGRADALTKARVASEGLLGGFQQIEQNRRDAPADDADRQLDLQRQEIALREQAEQILGAEQQARIRNAVAARDFAGAIGIVDERLRSVNLTTVEETNLLGMRADLVRRQLAYENDVTIAHAKRAASNSEYGAALRGLDAQLNVLTRGTAEYLRVEKARDQILAQSIRAEEAHEDSITRTALAQRNLQAAMQSNQAAMGRTDPHDPRDQPRRDALLVERAEIERRMADEMVRGERAAIRKAMSERRYADALQIVRDALARTGDATTAGMNLRAREVQILNQVERETRLMADAAIRDARAQGDRARALRLVNEELERQRNLPQFLGGLGGIGGGGAGTAGGVPTTPGAPGGGSGNDSTPRIEQLKATQSAVEAMPTAFSRAGAAAMRYVGPVAAVTAAYGALYFAQRQLVEGMRDLAQLQLTERSLQALFDNVNRGTETLEEAIEFGRRFGITQREMAEAAGEAGIILQGSTVGAERAFTVLERLRTRAPQQNFGAAVRSIAELQAGQLQSIERVFNIPRRFAHEMSDAIKAGMDPLEALDEVLNKLGQTEAVLEARQTGLTRAFNDVRIAATDLRVEAAKALEGPTTLGAQVLTEMLGGTADAMKLVAGRSDEMAGSQARAAIALNMLPTGLKEIVVGLGAMQREVEPSTEAIADIRRAAIEASPALARLFDTSAATRASDEITGLNQRVNALMSRYNQGQITAQQFYEGIQAARRITNDQDDDPSVAIEGIKRIRAEYQSVEDQIGELTAFIGGLQAAMGADTRLEETLGADVDAAVAELRRLEAMSPITILAKLNVEQISNATQTIDNIANQGKQTQEELDTLLNSSSETITGLIAQRDQLAADHYDNIAKSRREFARQQRADNAALEREQGLAAAEFRRTQDQAIADRATARQAGDIAFERSQERERTQLVQQQSRERMESERAAAMALTEFQRGQVRQRAEFERSAQRELADFARQQQQEDMERRREQQRESEDREVELQRRERDRRQEDNREEQQHLRDLAKAREDYLRERLRSQQDFEDEYRGLIMTGRRAEALVARFRFNRDQGRRDEDFQRGLQEGGTARTENVAERRRQRQQQDADEATDRATAERRRSEDQERQRAQQQAEFTRRQAIARGDFEYQQQLAVADYDYRAQLAVHNAQRQQAIARWDLEQRQTLAREDHNRTRSEQDQQFNEQYNRRETEFTRQQQQQRDNLAYQQQLATDDFDRRLNEMKAEFTKQRNEINGRIKEETDKYVASRTEILNAYDAYYKEQLRLLELSNAELLRAEELKALGVGEKEAQVVAALETAMGEYRRILGQGGSLLASGGYVAGIAWAENLARGILTAASAARLAARHAVPVPQRPQPPTNPLSYQEYLRQQQQQPQSAGPRRQPTPANLLNPTAFTAQDAARLQTAPSGPTSSQRRTPVNINVQAPPIIMDGQTVGKLSAPYAYQEVVGDFEVAVTLQESSSQPALQQQGFRTVR